MIFSKNEESQMMLIRWKDDATLMEGWYDFDTMKGWYDVENDG